MSEESTMGADLGLGVPEALQEGRASAHDTGLKDLQEG